MKDRKIEELLDDASIPVKPEKKSPLLPWWKRIWITLKDWN